MPSRSVRAKNRSARARATDVNEPGPQRIHLQQRLEDVEQHHWAPGLGRSDPVIGGVMTAPPHRFGDLEGVTGDEGNGMRPRLLPVARYDAEYMPTRAAYSGASR